MKILVLAAAVVFPAIAAAQPWGLNLDQSVARSSITVQSVTIGTTFSQVDSPKLEGSFAIEVQNLSVEQVCCSFDSGASAAAGSGRACQRIDTAPTASRPSATAWKRWKRWASSLSLWCRTLKTGNSDTAEIIVTQER